MNIRSNAKLAKLFAFVVNKFTHPKLKSYFLHRVITPNDMYYSYHKKLEHISVEDFEKRITYLQKHNSFIGLDEYEQYVLQGRKLTANRILLTFDDGYRSLYSVVFPILKKYSLPAAVFLTTGSITNQTVPFHDQLLYSLANAKGSKLSLDEFGFGEFYLNSEIDVINTYRKLSRQLKAVNNSMKLCVLDSIIKQLKISVNDFPANEMITWDQLKEMIDSGLLSVGAHTVTHPILSRLNEADAKDELLLSKAEIEARLAVSVRTVAYPNGRLFDINKTTIDIVKESYAIGFCTAGRHWSESPYMITRLGFDDMSEGNFYLVDAGLINPFERYVLTDYEREAYNNDCNRIELSDSYAMKR